MKSIPSNCNYFNMPNISVPLNELNLYLKELDKRTYKIIDQLPQRNYLVAYTDASIERLTNKANYVIFIPNLLEISAPPIR
jgi:hypothetical protein